jgi:hypothetical protein
MTYQPPNLNWCYQSHGMLQDLYVETRALFQTQSDATWPVANLALYVPIYVHAPITVSAISWNNGSPAGNSSAGLYDEGGNRLVQTGVVAVAGSGAPQSVSVGPLTIPAGRYWCGMAHSSATTTFRTFNSTLNVGPDANKWFGIGEEATTGTQVPTTMTPSVSARSYIPMLALRTVPQAII